MNIEKINLPTWQMHIESEWYAGVLSKDLGNVLSDIVAVGDRLGTAIRQYGLMDEITGSTMTLNLHGEQVKKLDDYANHLFIDTLMKNKYCAAIVSEEEPEAIRTHFSSGKYLIFIDPLDGSSNIDSHVSTGTIFSIYEKRSTSNGIQESDLLQKGSQQVAAGYILYSSSTIMVYSAGKDVHGFTYHQEHGNFYHTHPTIRIPEKASVYSTNEGNAQQFPSYVQQYLQFCKKEASLRYVGSIC
jgi:fructose-1,6-bisphosphatase I